MIDISNNPRVSQIVGRIEDMARDLELDPGSPERPAGELRIGELYLEMGRYVHWLLRQDPAAVARIGSASKTWSDELDAKLGPKGAQALPPLPPPPARLPRPEPPAAPAAAPVVAAAPVEVPEVIAIEEEEELEEIADLEIVEDILVEPVDADEGSNPDLRSASDPPETAWVRDLNDLLQALGPPEQGRLTEDQAQRAANRLLNATTQMEMRWMGFPDSVQHALLALIGCRARNLQDRMPVDVELRMALGRMRRFHGARRLPQVKALEDDARPEQGSWELDSARWWKLLDRGV